jgi:thiol-disulfide isomerase/thioredoxin
LAVVDLLRWSLAAVLLGAAVAKLLSGGAGRVAFRSYGIKSSRARAVLWSAVIAAELALGIAVAARVPGAAEAAAGMLAVFALALVAAIARGRAGRPCACFGGSSRIGWPAAVRAMAIAAGFAALPFLPGTRPSTQTWLAVGLIAALAGFAGLAVAVFALARELGELRLAVAPQAALSLEHEGPELGSRVGVVEHFEGSAPLSVAIFSSPGCPLCQALEPAVRLVAADPAIELEVFDEERDADVWSSLSIPGSPYGVALGPSGEVLAKGTFNTLVQLEGLLAAAARRAREAAPA